MMTINERFDAKWQPEPTTGCHLWTAHMNSDGYGQFRMEGRTRIAHRFAYERAHGPVPDGLELDHLCRTCACVNPDHLEAVPHAVNVARGEGGAVAGARMAAKTHCPAGHSYDPANTYRKPDGGRKCRTCKRARDRASRARTRLPHGVSP